MVNGSIDDDQSKPRKQRVNKDISEATSLKETRMIPSSVTRTGTDDSYKHTRDNSKSDIFTNDFKNDSGLNTSQSINVSNSQDKAKLKLKRSKNRVGLN